MPYLFKKIALLLTVSHFVVLLIAQNEPTSTIHSIESPKNHYESLQKLSALPNEAFSTMDTLAFSPSMYNSYALAMSQSTPYYLTISQLDFLKNSVAFPANSSNQTRAELDFLCNYSGTFFE